MNQDMDSSNIKDYRFEVDFEEEIDSHLDAYLSREDRKIKGPEITKVVWFIYWLIMINWLINSCDSLYRSCWDHAPNP